MKIKLTIFLTLIGLLGFSQNPWNEQTKSFYTGNDDHIDFYSNGRPRLKCFVRNGNLEGEMISYYKNGQIQDSSHFENGHYHGIIKTFNKKGKLIIEEKYKHDTLLYRNDVHYYKNGNIRIKDSLMFDADSLKANPFLKKKYHSLSASIGYDETLTISTMKSHGKYIEYFKNGKIKEEIFTVNDLFDGVDKWYHEDGSLAGEGTFLKDNAEGIFTYYSTTGQITKTETWKDGKLIKTETWKDGKIIKTKIKHAL